MVGMLQPRGKCLTGMERWSKRAVCLSWPVDYESGGWKFESFRARQIIDYVASFFWRSGPGLPVGCAGQVGHYPDIQPEKVSSARQRPG